MKILDFKLRLMNTLLKIEKPLTFNEKNKEKYVVRKIQKLVDKHYFCPSDELPKIIMSNTNI